MQNEELRMIRVELCNFFEGEEREQFINIYKFIMSQEGDEFEIWLPTDWEMAYTNYGYSAYAGELLCEVAESFEYFVPEKGLEQALFFRITVADKEKLADVLEYILEGYCGGKDDMKFCNAAMEYWNGVFERKRKTACLGIMEKLDSELVEEEKERERERKGKIKN